MKRSLLVMEILFLVALLTLTGCVTAPQERIVVKTETKLIKTPESLLMPCEVTAPPSKTEYVSKTAQQKEATLTDYALNLLKDLRICNNQIKQVKDFQTKEAESLEKVKAK